nr:MAG TPA: hypothetical protein [Caudoviricetes sp.]
MKGGAAQWLHTRTCSSFVFSSLAFAACLFRYTKRSNRPGSNPSGYFFLI